MKKKLLIAVFLMTSCGAFAQSGQKALDATTNLRDAQVTSSTHGNLSGIAATPLIERSNVAAEKKPTPVKGAVQESNQHKEPIKPRDVIKNDPAKK